MKSSCIILVALLLPFFSHSQDLKYWIFLSDKDTTAYDYHKHLSEEAIERRLEQQIPLSQFTDIPIKANYLSILKEKGIKIVQQSKWLNAVTAILTPEQIKILSNITFIQKIEPINNRFKILKFPNYKEIEFVLTIEQMEIEEMVKAKLDGAGITIGVIDAGYVGASQNEYLQHLFDEKRILGIKDLINPVRTEHFKQAETTADSHGNTVLQMITGYEKGGSQYGFATKSQFYLARTDHGDSEFRGEEDYWVSAMEWLDSLGVRVINTSLGYALGFDNPKENYKPEQMDGKTSVISKAAQIATEEKGLLLVVSAGNEGNDANWLIVSTPADSKSVLSVGATQPNGLKAGYSSIGADFLPYLKPNISCFSANGTSFSAPVVTGFAACLMQKNRKATNKEIFAIIEKSSHLYPYGNNYIGYGIPKSSKALQLMDNYTENELATKKPKVISEKLSYDFKVKNSKVRLQIFHKKNETIVVSQDIVSVSKGKYTVVRPENVLRTTLVADNEIIEIFWEGETPKQLKKAQRKALKAAKKEQRKQKRKI
jgi:subtilisin family serine protease